MTKLKSIKSFCLFMIGLSVFSWYVVAAVRKHKFEIHPLCSSTLYGSVLSRHNDVKDVASCAAVCMDNSQCESCTYDETSEVCALNSVIRVTTQTCSQNVKYAQKREYQCVSSGGTYKICGLDLYAVSGELTGYIEVNRYGVWGTVCDDLWSVEYNGTQNANVFCGSFGYSAGFPIYPLDETPVIYHGPIVMDDIQCLGSENELLSCSHTSPVTHCSHFEDVRVRCYT